jgi:curved DNA-binding protein CbpA
VRRNHYEVLGLEAGASPRQVKAKYRELARKFHPDLVKDKVFALRVFKQINQAYHVLGDPDRRAEYDIQLRNARAWSEAQSTSHSPNGQTSTATATATANRNAAVDRLLREADMAIMQGHASDARRLCNAVLDTYPENVEALETLGDSLVMLRETEKAIDVYRKVLAISHSHVVQSRLVQLEKSLADKNGAHPGQAPKPKQPERRLNFFQRLFRRRR